MAEEGVARCPEGGGQVEPGEGTLNWSYSGASLGFLIRLCGSLLLFFQESLVLVGFGGVGGAALATIGERRSWDQQGLGNLVMRWQEATRGKESGELESGGRRRELQPAGLEGRADSTSGLPETLWRGAW